MTPDLQPWLALWREAMAPGADLTALTLRQLVWLWPVWLLLGVVVVVSHLIDQARRGRRRRSGPATVEAEDWHAHSRLDDVEQQIEDAQRRLKRLDADDLAALRRRVSALEERLERLELR